MQIKYSIINDKIVEDFHFIYFYEEQDKMEGRGVRIMIIGNLRIL